MSAGREGPSDLPVTGTVTRADLAERLRRHGFSHREAAILVREVFAIMGEVLERGEPVKLSRFGRFEVVRRACRQGRNLLTGEPLDIDARNTVAWRPSARLREALTEALSSYGQGGTR